MSIGLKGNSDGSGAVQVGGSDAITISTGLNTTFAGTVTSSTGALYPLSSGTAVASTSGTSIDFTGIPATAKRVTVMFNGVSTSGTSNYQIQLGSTTFSTSGYLGSTSAFGGAATAFSAGILFCVSPSVGTTIYGTVTLSLISANIWAAGVTTARGDAAQPMTGGGNSPNLAGILDRVRITTVNGTDTFDAGSINILWE